MSSSSDGPDFQTYLLYRQWEQSRNQGVEASQHPTNQVQRPTAQRIAPSRSRPQPYQQSPLRFDITTIFQELDYLKRRADETFVAFGQMSVGLGHISETLGQISETLGHLQTDGEKNTKTFEAGVAVVTDTIGNLQQYGKEMLERVVSQSLNGAPSQPPSNPSRPSQHTSQPPIFPNPQKTYQGPNVTQPTAPFIASSNTTQPSYARPASQPADPYTETYIDFGFDLLANEPA